MLEESVSLWASMYSWFTPTVLFVFLNLMIGTIAITSSLATSSRTTDNNPHHPHQLGRSPSVLQRLRSVNFHAYRSPDPVAGFDKSSEFHQHTPEPQDGQYHEPQSFLSRSPSVLQRLRSFNLYNYISNEQQAAGSPDVKRQEASRASPEVGNEETESPEQEDAEEETLTIDEIYSKLKGTQVRSVGRTKSDTEPASGAVPPRLARKMRKSASTKSPFNHFEEEDVVEARRPATVREGKSSSRLAAEEEQEEEVAGAADEQVDAKADDFINRFKQQLKMQRMDSIMRYKESVKRGSSKA